MHHKRTPTWLVLGLTGIFILVIAVLFSLNGTPAQAAQPSTANASSMAEGGNPPTPVAPTPVVHVDHSQFEILQQPFEKPQDVTKACLSCHEDAAQDIMHTTHWTWEFVNETTGQVLGKKHVINDFCISPQSNEPRCTSCHVGYGWKDKNFDFSAEENVDCLVCHDTTGTYKKSPPGAGYPADTVDLNQVALNVGPTSRQTCGACHFYGGGGNEVKHGDLDSSLVNPPYDLDVHMSPEGGDFSCTTCHTTDHHNIQGSRYSMDPEQWKGCESCHTSAPHSLSILNQHAEKVACQTCHIPEYARGGFATKMYWDWSKAGEFNPDGSIKIVKDEHGNVIYHTFKGEFIDEEDVVPEYVWFNGTVQYTLATDTIDPNSVVSINKFEGSKDDPNAKIWPVKHFTGVQPYDSGNNTLVVPHLFGKDDTAYWGNFDWGKAIQAGMDYAGLPYSGEYGFIKTEMYWPITHMVAPAEDALQCQDCHTAENGRLDFAALGYSEEDVQRLTHFPPTSLNPSASPQSPQACAECHESEFEQWSQSKHGEVGTGCVACHSLEGEGEHPNVAYTIDKGAETCAACHLDEYTDWKDSKHGEVNISCVACHNPHTQEQRVNEGNSTSCESCHHEEAADAQHSTHAAAGVTCTDCHKNTHENTGHTFTIEKDTCINCHGETIHTADAIVTGAGLTTDLEKPTEEAPAQKTTEELAEEQAATAGIHATPPLGVSIVVGIILLVGIFWIFFTKDSEAESDDSSSES